MEIDKTKCVGCGNCHAVCTMGAIYLGEDGTSEVNQDQCVECSTCYKVLVNEKRSPSFVRTVRKTLSMLKLAHVAPPNICPTGALTPPALEWPRVVRAFFSDPLTTHPSTGMKGRGTEEIKTNDVTNRIQTGEAGLVVELGRPGTGAYFRDIEKVAMALAREDGKFETENPVTQLMSDPEAGRIRKDVLNEKVLSAIIEIKIPLDAIPAVLCALHEIEAEIDATMAVGISSRCLPDGTIPHTEWVIKAGYGVSPNGKTNLGLGRPICPKGEA
jgi:ferredoxin